MRFESQFTTILTLRKSFSKLCQTYRVKRLNNFPSRVSYLDNADDFVINDIGWRDGNVVGFILGFGIELGRSDKSGLISDLPTRHIYSRTALHHDVAL